MARGKVKKKTIARVTRPTKRLSDEQKLAIANEPADVSLSAITEKYGVSMPTAMRYRAQRPTTSAASSSGGDTLNVNFTAEFVEGKLQISLSKADLLRALAESERA